MSPAPAPVTDLRLALSLAAGAACIALFAFAALSALTSGKADDRRYKDPLPVLWRLAWPLVLPLSRGIAPWLSVGRRRALADRLRGSGLDFSLNVEQFVAGRLVAAALAFGGALVLWSPRGIAPVTVLVAAAAIGWLLPGSWLRDRGESRRRAILRHLPFFLDVITLSVESGMNLGSALAQAVDKGPRGPLRVEFERTLRDLRAGRGREEALRGMADRLAMPAIGSLVAALLVAEKQGSALGPVLRAQAEQRRHERFLRAEKLAMEAPVKMLPPLLVFIFPCTFVVLLFPVVSRFIQEGWLR
ncbi:MAG: hypothetical protein RIS35_861 [Pseudomonadota bacterium]|jgi:tight adherence protein C